MKYITYILLLVNLLGSKPCKSQNSDSQGFKGLLFSSNTPTITAWDSCSIFTDNPLRITGGYIMNETVSRPLFITAETRKLPTESMAYNTIIGYGAAKYLTDGSYNFIIGDDSTAVNIPYHASNIWYIQPSAKYFIQNAECLRCLLSAYPQIYGILPEDKALEIITNARKCLPNNYFIRN